MSRRASSGPSVPRRGRCRYGSCADRGGGRTPVYRTTSWQGRLPKVRRYTFRASGRKGGPLGPAGFRGRCRQTAPHLWAAQWLSGIDTVRDASTSPASVTSNVSAAIRRCPSTDFFEWTAVTVIPANAGSSVTVFREW